MLDMINQNPITKIARVLPARLIESFEKHSFYSVEDVTSIFESELKTEHNFEYALAMFCSQSDFEELNLEYVYRDLRIVVSKECFDGWPRFNFDSLLDYSRRSTEGVNGGTFGGDGSCGDGGCGE